MAAVAALAAKLAKLATLARRALAELLNPLAAANRSVMALLGVGAALLIVAAIVPMLVVVLFAGSAAAGEGGWSKDVPEAYRGMYEAASKEYDVNKYLLAAIHSVETSFGTSDLPGVSSGQNFAGAMGPMQFLAGTWESYEESFEPIEDQRPDAYPLHRDELASCRGVPDDTGCVYDSFDAIAGAADYLAESGADQDLDSDGTRDAVLAYNHSDAYVNEVLELARKFQKDGAASGGAKAIVDRAAEIAEPFGTYVCSTIRPGDTVDSGELSDHSSNNSERAARDICVRGVNAFVGPPPPELDRAIVAIGEHFSRDYRPEETIRADEFDVNGYRVQIIWRTPEWGGHMGHIHVGACGVC